jgi:hypothetical protein
MAGNYAYIEIYILRCAMLIFILFSSIVQSKFLQNDNLVLFSISLFFFHATDTNACYTYNKFSHLFFERRTSIFPIGLYFILNLRIPVISTIFMWYFCSYLPYH